MLPCCFHFLPGTLQKPAPESRVLPRPPVYSLANSQVTLILQVIQSLLSYQSQGPVCPTWPSWSVSSSAQPPSSLVPALLRPSCSWTISCRAPELAVSSAQHILSSSLHSPWPHFFIFSLRCHLTEVPPCPLSYSWCTHTQSFFLLPACSSAYAACHSVMYLLAGFN